MARCPNCGKPFSVRFSLRPVDTTPVGLVPTYVPADESLPLSPAELRVLRLLAYGLTNKEIAREIGRSYETVRNQIMAIGRKLGTTNRTQAVIIALQRGIISTEDRRVN